jgi:AcrR family transcriptional regulator
MAGRAADKDTPRSGVARRSQAKQSSAAAGAAGARRAEILATAARVFAVKGFANSTVRDIGDDCGILSGSLYYYFASKDAMLLEILENAMEGLLAEYSAVRDGPSDAESKLVRLFEVALRFIVGQPHAALILQSEFHRIKQLDTFAPALARYNEIKLVWRTILEQGVAEDLLRADVELDLAYRVLMGAVLSTVHWFDPRGRYSIETVAKNYSAILIDGLARQPKPSVRPGRR